VKKAAETESLSSSSQRKKQATKIKEPEVVNERKNIHNNLFKNKNYAFFIFCKEHLVSSH
jgi:hypothetical protein